MADCLSKNDLKVGQKLYALNADQSFKAVFIRKIGTKYIYVAATERPVPNERDWDIYKVDICSINRRCHTIGYCRDIVLFTNPKIYSRQKEVEKMAEELYKAFDCPSKYEKLGYDRLKDIYEELTGRKWNNGNR